MQKMGVSCESSGMSFKKRKLVKMNICLYPHLWFSHFRLTNLSKSVLMNIMVYEINAPRIKTWVTNYFYFLSGIVFFEHDIRILREANIIQHNLGTDLDALKFVCDIKLYTKPSKFYFEYVKAEIQAFYESYVSSFCSRLGHGGLQSEWKVCTGMAIMWDLNLCHYPDRKRYYYYFFIFLIFNWLITGFLLRKLVKRFKRCTGRPEIFV